MLLFVHIQFLAQLPRQAKTGDEAIDGQIPGDPVFAVDDLQYQFSLRLLQPLNEFLMASLDLVLELRCRRLFAEAVA